MGTVEKKKAEQGAGHRECRGEGQVALSIKGSLVHVFYVVIQQIFPECLLCAACCRHSSEQDGRGPFHPGASRRWPERTVNSRQTRVIIAG